MGLGPMGGNAFAHGPPPSMAAAPGAANLWAEQFAAVSRTTAGVPATAIENSRDGRTHYPVHQGFVAPHPQMFAPPIWGNPGPAFHGINTGHQAQPVAPAPPQADLALRYSDAAMEEAFEEAFKMAEAQDKDEAAVDQQFKEVYAYGKYEDEFEKEMAAWMAVHGPSATAAAEDQHAINENLTKLADITELQTDLADKFNQHMSIQQIQELSHAGSDEQQQKQTHNEDQDADLRRTANDIVLNIGGNARFETSQFVQLMRSIVAGDVALDASQTDFVDVKTKEPVTNSYRAANSEHNVNQESYHPPISGLPAEHTLDFPRPGQTRHH